MQQNLEKYRNTVDLEDAADAGLAYLVRVEQFELLGALVEVVTQGDAVAPALDLPALGPELNVNRVTGLEHPAKGADVFDLFFRGDMADSSCKRLRPRRHRCLELKKLHNLAVLSFRIYPSLKYSNNRNAVINNTIKSVNTNNTLPKQISVEFFLSFIRKRRTRKAFIVTNKVITNVGTNVNKNLPMITLTGDAFQAERASSLVPK